MNEGPRYGSYCLTFARVLAGWGAVSERRWPYPRGAVIWPPVEPAGLDQIARFNRLLSHFRIRSLEDARTCLAFHGPFNFAVPITASGRSASEGVVPDPDSRMEFVENHAVLAVGYDDKTELLKFQNSWGERWGQGGYGYLPYRYFETRLLDAWFEQPMTPGRWRPEFVDQAFAERLMMFPNGLGHPSAIIDLWDMANDVRLAWCFMTLRDGYLDVEDFFVRPGLGGSSHQDRLVRLVIKFANQENLQLRLWVAHADIRSCAANFGPINDFVRATALKMRPSRCSWAAFVAY